MGDMADYYVDLALDAGEGFAPRHRERRGNYGYRYSSDIPKSPRCNRCGANTLHWGQLNGKWRLYEGNRLHDCTPSPTADGFEDEPV